jgi:hypothetical protein
VHFVVPISNLVNSRNSDEESRLIPEESPDEGLNLVADFDKDFLDVKAEPLESGGEPCDSCYSNYEANDFFALKCGHRFCINCNIDHLQTRIQSGKAMKLPCMQFKCKELFNA